MKLNNIIDTGLFEKVDLFFNETLQSDKDAKWFIYDGDGYGTPNAIVLASGEVNGVSSLSTRIPITERASVVVAIGLRTAQLVTNTLSSYKNGGKFSSLVAAIERNYYDPDS